MRKSFWPGLNASTAWATAATVLCLPFMLAQSAQSADRALLIGIDVYEHPRLTFKIPDASKRDVKNMYRLLTGTLGYEPANVKVITDKQATKKRILGEIRSWLGGTKPGDRAFLFYVGHGSFQKDLNGDEDDGLDETIVPHDTKIVIEGTKGKLKGMITDDELNEALATLKKRHVTAVFDSCHSGTVTRSVTPTFNVITNSRTPKLESLTRAITVEPAAQEQKKAKGTLGDPGEVRGSTAFWSAVAPSQVALIDTTKRPNFSGVFTSAFVRGLETKAADANGNGTVSNAELLAYVRKESDNYCKNKPKQCEMGLTPQLEPRAALTAELTGKTPIASAPKPPKATPGKLKKKLTAATVLDILGKGNSHNVTLQQFPPSPVRLGAKNIKFKVTSPHDGYLVLLNLSDKGELIQLYPNQFSRRVDRESRILANSTITVPDAYYGISFNATKPSSGTLIALVLMEPIDWPKLITARKISVIPAETAKKEYLPALAQAINKPTNKVDPTKNTGSVDWSVATLRYEITH